MKVYLRNVIVSMILLILTIVILLILLLSPVGDSLKETIQQVDEKYLLLINNCNTLFWDNIMWFASGKWSWLPFYTFLLIVLIWKFKREAISMILLILLLITLSDQIASGLFKPLIERLRPSHEFHLENKLHFVSGYKGGKYGFMSSHASNVFSLAFYLTVVCYKEIKWLPYILIPWAFFVSISRIYLGVHYPTDIIVPLLLSVFIAGFTANLHIFIKNQYNFLNN